jgi:RNA polymerase sigma factor (TIGR02999 family)
MVSPGEPAPAGAGTLTEEASVTRLLAAARGGDATAQERLYALVYDDLRRIAHRQLGASAPGDGTLQTTALVHEAYLRLARHQRESAIADRVHFFALAARAMRQILIDGARRRRAEKRGGGVKPIDLDALPIAVPVLTAAEDLLALDVALTQLETQDPRLGQLVECHFYGGMNFEEIGSLQGLSERTVKRDWRKARAFLYARLQVGLAAGAPAPN